MGIYYVRRMETEDEICTRYEAELAAIAALDRRYYLNRSAGVADRAAYAARQARLEHVRLRLYAELDALRSHKQFRRCRTVIRQSHIQGPP